MPASDPDEVAPLVRWYDRAYRSSGKPSRWTRDHRDRLLPRDFDMMVQSALRSVPPQRRLVVLDDGCGDGRARTVIDFLATRGIKSEWIGYDISAEGLRQFEQKLLAEGYRSESGEGSPDISRGFVYRVLRRADGCTVRLVLGMPSDSLSYTAKLIGPVDFTASLYGLLCHLPERRRRIERLQLYRKITSGDVLLSIFNSTPLTRRRVRRNLTKKGLDLVAMEKGLIRYETEGCIVEILLSRESLMRKEIADAGLHIVRPIDVQYLQDELQLAKHPLLAKWDSMGAVLLSFRALALFRPIFARYQLFTVRRA